MSRVLFSPVGALVRGAYLASRAVSASYGPSGGQVLISRGSRGVISTRDGATIAMDLSLPQGPLQVALSLVQQACRTQHEVVGDGTTTTALLLSSLLKRAYALLEGGIDVDTVASLLEDDEAVFLQALESLRIPFSWDHVHDYAIHVMHGDTQCADALCEALDLSGDRGSILVRDGLREGVHVIASEGEIAFDSVLNSSFQDHGNLPHTLYLPLIYISPTPLVNVSEGVKVMEEASTLRSSEKAAPDPLCFFAPWVSRDVLRVLHTNNSHWKALIYVTCSIPGSRWEVEDAIQDLQVVCGGHPSNSGMPVLECLGQVNTLTLYKDRISMTPMKDREIAISNHASRLISKAHSLPEGHDHQRDVLIKKSGQFNRSLVNIEVKALTEMEAKVLRSRMEDGVLSMRSAIQGGLVPGGGLSFLWGAQGTHTFKGAFEHPFFQVLRHHDEVAHLLKGDMMDPWVGYDITTGDFRDFQEHPYLMDSYASIRSSVHLAVSTVKTILRVGCGVFL